MIWAANAILAIHLAFIIFAVLGGVLLFFRPWMIRLHIPAVAWAAYIEFSGRICPLTPLENRFRALAGQSGYDHGVIHHFLLQVIYPDGLTRTVQILLGTGVLVFNLLVYGYYFSRARNRRKR